MNLVFDFGDAQKLNSYFRPFTIAIVPIQAFLWPVNCTILFCKLCLLFETITDLWPVLILEVLSIEILRRVSSILRNFFCLILVCKLYKPGLNIILVLDMCNVLFEGF